MGGQGYSELLTNKFICHLPQIYMKSCTTYIAHSWVPYVERGKPYGGARCTLTTSSWWQTHWIDLSCTCRVPVYIQGGPTCTRASSLLLKSHHMNLKAYIFSQLLQCCHLCFTSCLSGCFTISPKFRHNNLTVIT